MAADDRAVHVPSAERREALPATPGMHREEAIVTDGMWAGVTTTEAGMTSGWHHHGEYDSSIYVASGTLRMESGPGGSDVVDAQAGDFVFVPRHAIHREGNPGHTHSELVIVRAGTGPTVINVDGPAPA